jgi:CHAD domain-containing protein
MYTAENTLTPREQVILQAISDQPATALSRRARLILQWSIDPDPDRLAAASGLRPTQVRHWLRAFSKVRLEIFPADTLWLASRGLDGSLTVDELCRRYAVDLPHARHTVHLALTLFDQTAAIHQLAVERRRLLEAAALLHNLGAGIDAANHHVVGRDIVAAHTLVGFSAVERDMIACQIMFHRKRIKPKSDLLFATLAPEVQHDTLVLAALLRIAGGLDYSGDQTTHIRAADVPTEDATTRTAIEVRLEGPHAAIDAARANQKADLWRTLFSVPFRFSVGDKVVAQTAVRRTRRTRKFGLRPTDLMAEAGRSIIAFHFQRARELEAGVIDGDEEAVHDMRVAVRRMRATLRLARAHYKPKDLAYFRGRLSELADRLGTVRDLDVIMTHGLTFAQQHTRSPRLDAWLDHLKARRASAHAKLVAYLKSKRYKKFTTAFEVFAHEPGRAVRAASEPIEPLRVCDVIPGSIWKQYGAVRVYEVSDDLSLTTLHALRIEVKRLRDGLQFFEEILGGAITGLIQPVVRLQDLLGGLQDAAVADNLLKTYLAEHPDDAGAKAYQAAVAKEIITRLDQFPEVWRNLSHKSFRKMLARVLGNL